MSEQSGGGRPQSEMGSGPMSGLGVGDFAKSAIEAGVEESKLFLKAAKDIAIVKGEELLTRARQIHPGYAALSIGLGVGAYFFGDAMHDWSVRFAQEGQGALEGFKNMMTAANQAFNSQEYMNKPELRQQLGSLINFGVPLFLTAAGGSIASGVRAVRGVFRGNA